TLLWHAGEPLVLPVSFYETATELLSRHNVDGIPVLQSFQTNATLIDAKSPCVNVQHSAQGRQRASTAVSDAGQLFRRNEPDFPEPTVHPGSSCETAWSE